MTPDPVTTHQEPHRERQLTNRHIQLSAIGGACGHCEGRILLRGNRTVVLR